VNLKNFEICYCSKNFYYENEIDYEKIWNHEKTGSVPLSFLAFVLETQRRKTPTVN
jgi:hypothetical protein